MRFKSIRNSTCVITEYGYPEDMKLFINLVAKKVPETNPRR